MLLAVALASSSLGIPLLLAVALEVLGRPDRRARWWVVVAPAVLYGAWYVGYGGSSSSATSDNLFGSPSYVAEAAAGAAGALFSLGRDWGRTLAVGLVVALLLSLHRRGHASWRLIALIAAPLGFWFLTAVARGQLGEPASPRYLYPGAVFLLLIAVEASAGVRLARGALAVGAVFLAGALLGNVGAMREGAGFLRDESTSVDGALAALPLVAKRVGADFQPDPDSAPQIRSGPYLAAVRDLGSPAPGPRALPGMYERARAQRRRGAAARAQPAADAERGCAERGRAEGRLRPVGVGAAQGARARRSPRRAAPRSRTSSCRPGACSCGRKGRSRCRCGGSRTSTATSRSRRCPPAARSCSSFPPDASPVPWHARLAFGGAVRACARG